MMKNHLLSFVSKRSILLGGGILILTLLVITAVHIYMVTTPKSDGYVNTEHQIARLDLQGNPSTNEMQTTLSIVRNQPGVLNAYLNPTAKTIAYIYASNQTTSTAVFNALSRGTPSASNTDNTIKAVKYYVAPTTNGSCPMNATQASMFRRIGAFMHSILD
jgi:hypothetical protein